MLYLCPQNIKIMEGLKSRVKDLVSERKITLKKLAADMGISTVWLNNILNDDDRMSLRHLKRIAEILDVDLWELLYDKEDLVSSIKNENVGFQVRCPYCHRVLTLGK